MRFLIILSSILFINVELFSQDLLYKTSGEEIEVKVTEVGEDYLIYKKKGLENGPDFRIYLKNVFMVIFENGEKMLFNNISNEENKISKSDKESKISKSDKESNLSKFYLGIGAGYASKGGDVKDWYSGGVFLNFLNFGYRINGTWGVTANINSARYSYVTVNGYNTLNNSALSIGSFSVGPMVTIPTEYFTIDIKPQLVITEGVYTGDILDHFNIDEYYLDGSGFVLGTSIVRSTKKGFTYSLDLDYQSSSFYREKRDGIYVEEDYIFKYHSLRVGIGVRYNFRTK